jgi:hypothetical protein
MRDKITFIIKKAFTMGITIKAVVSDMGPQNRSVWRLFGITACKHSQIKNYTPHPCDELSNQKLYISPDPVHIFKNICGALTDGNIFELEESIVRQYNLPSNSVSIQPVQKVCELDKADTLKLCPRLKESMLYPTDFQKIGMKPSRRPGLVTYPTSI